MFWKINFRPASAIDGLLDKPDCTLNEILDEDDVLQEIKSQNKKLVEFLMKPENMEELVKYVCIVADPEMDDKYKFKYPHLACEILTADVFSIVETLCNDEKYLPMLWQFLYEESRLNPLIGSFNSKVLSMLLGQRTLLYIDYVTKVEGFVDMFMKHLGTSAMMDLLLQMIAAPDNDQHRLELANWLTEEGIVYKLIDFIRPSANVDHCVNASQALCDLLRISREAMQISGPSPLLKMLESKEAIDKLLFNMFEEDDPPDWVIINGVAVLLTALERKQMGGGYSPTFNRSYNSAIQTSLNDELADANLENIIVSISCKILHFHKLLLRQPQCEPMITTFGLLDPPLGNMRLQIVRLFSSLLNTHDPHVQKEVILHSTCSVLLDLFFKYPWNNFLHAQVESCIVAALSSTGPITLDFDSGTGQVNESTSLRQNLLNDGKLVQRLLEGAEHNDVQVNEMSGTRLGYMGHLVRMANQIAGNTRALGLTLLMDQGRDDIAMTTIDDERLQSELDEDTYYKWSVFMSGPVAEMNRRNDTNLGGTRPLTSSMDDSDEEYDQLNMGPDNELDKAFQQYQDCRLSSSFMDDFGLGDELDPALISYASTYSTLTEINCNISANESHTQYMAGFEAACSERIQPFDDSESDDEENSPWLEKEISFVSSIGIGSGGSSEEGEGDKKQRMFPTELSDEEESVSEKRERPVAVGGASSSNDNGMISWKSEFATDEDLSGNNDWTQEPSQNQKQNWAEFTAVSFGKSEVKEDNPKVVSVTYVSIKGMDDHQTNPYTVLSNDNEEEDDNNNEIIDPNLLNISQRSLSESSEDDVESSDEERSINVNSEGDSGNPLLSVSNNNDESHNDDGGDVPSQNELIGNYKYLSNQGLMNVSHSINHEDKKPNEDIKVTEGVESSNLSVST